VSSAPRRWIVETIVAVAAVLVAVSAVFVAVQANKIASRQTELTERQLEPIITAEHHYESRRGRADTEHISVRNLGPPAQGVDADEITLLIVTRATREETVRRVLAVQRHYGSFRYSGKATGLLVTLTGSEGNNARMTKLDRASADYGRRRREILLFDLRTFLRVGYSDQLGHAHTTYLEARPIGGAVTVDPARGRRIFELEDDRPFDAFGAGPHDLMNAFSAAKHAPERLGLL